MKEEGVGNREVMTHCEEISWKNDKKSYSGDMKKRRKFICKFGSERLLWKILWKNNGGRS